MTARLTGNGILEIAIGIEKRGISFYDVMAKSADSETARAVFQELVTMEREHIQIFEDMLNDTDPYSLPEALDSEYTDYLQSLIADTVFTDDQITSEMAAQADNDIKALELAVGAEKDSILFYYEMRDIMPMKAQQAITRILDEEKRHLQQLTQVKKIISSL